MIAVNVKHVHPPNGGRVADGSIIAKPRGMLSREVRSHILSGIFFRTVSGKCVVFLKYKTTSLTTA